MHSNQIETHYEFGSGNIVQKRTIRIYLPPDYFDETKRLPVLYLQDGQNLFDPETSFAGVAWRVDETADRLILKNKIPPLIIVGIDNTGLERINEYTPTKSRGKGGKANDYGKFLIEELKPFIDENYRTLPGRDFTGIGGSSLGGLFALYLGIKRRDVFSRLAIMSPSLWWGNGFVMHEVANLSARFPSRIWLDIGKREPNFAKNHARFLQEIFLSKGWQKNRNPRFADFRFFETPKGRHDEFSWGARFDRVLKFLYPKS